MVVFQTAEPDDKEKEELKQMRLEKQLVDDQWDRYYRYMAEKRKKVKGESENLDSDGNYELFLSKVR